jgi:hypothetical protein
MSNGNPHARIDAISLALDRATAAKIRAEPGLVEIGKANLRRWQAQNGGKLSPAHREWELILRFLTPDELVEFIVSRTPKADRLRQSSPLVGILTEAERLAILRAHEKIAA